jgi:hypothetical protein
MLAPTQGGNLPPIETSTPPKPAKPEQPKQPVRRTITLTHRAPIVIVDDDWPVIAKGTYRDGVGGPFEVDVSIRVRKDKFDRHLIHAHYSYGEEEEYESARVGRILDSNEPLWKNIVEVGEELRQRVRSDGLRKYVGYAVDHCFEDLPPIKGY